MQRFLVILFLAVASVVTSIPSQAEQDANSLIGVFTVAPVNSKIVGSQLTITGLLTSEATMIWPDGYETKLKKIFENPNLVVLQSISLLGSTDTIYIEKKNKRFLVVSVGAMETAVPSKSATLSQYRGSIK